MTGYPRSSNVREDLESSLPGQTGRSLEVLNSLEKFVAENINHLLKSVDENWQPSSILPNLSSEKWTQAIQEFRDSAARLTDELLVVLVGDMVTEEALPSYQTWLNNLAGINDQTGNESHAWGRWIRGWTAEENRHGDLLNRYLYLCGRVDMHAVETTVQYLIKNGFNPGTENDPYLGFIYTSFQERATKISHRNVAILASKAGDNHLRDICGVIAGDEARHEKAYKLFMRRIFEIDPVGAVLSFAKMMKKTVTMPAKLMEDGMSSNLFGHFSIVAQRLGVYTVHDYASIIDNLVRSWNVTHLTGLNGASAEAQDYVCGLSKRYEKLAERLTPPAIKRKFSWIFNREV